MLDVRGLGHAFDGRQAVEDLTFEVAEGELVCVVGPSGCGKSTLLRAVAGLLTPTAGRVLLRGEPVTGVPAELAVVFQDYGRSLFGWLTVARNVEFPLRWGPLTRGQRAERARDVLHRVGLTGVGELYPWQLSGGMQQRVAIARALAVEPSVLLMDEPFASVDAQTRFELEDLLRGVQREHRTTVLLVTHDVDESVYLSDRVLVLSPGPASLVADVTVELPAERDQITTRESAGFVAARGRVARLVRGADVGTSPDSVRLARS